MCDTIIKQQHVLHKLDLNIPIYKIMPLKYVLALLQSSNLYFQKTELWEDPYENFFLKQDFRMHDGRNVDAKELIPGIFGMCWTSKCESDALWRIYSSDKHSIRIRTTAAKLFDTIYRTDADANHAYVGKVIYRTITNIENSLSKMSPISPLDINNIWTQSMFVKRQEFSHEDEIRAILTFSPNEKQYKRDHLEYEINIQDFVEELTLDPRLNNDEADGIISSLTKVGADPNIVNRSELYSFRKQILEFL